jgi:hypothetical protein
MRFSKRYRFGKSPDRRDISVTLTISFGAYPIGVRREYGRILRIAGSYVFVRSNLVHQ